jgi:hypothetical protein
MSKIEFIKNITIFQDFSTGVTNFNQYLNINNQPDECIIRSISYAGPTATDISGTYLIWSNLTNDYICSFSIDASNTGAKPTHNMNISPNIQIHFKQPLVFYKYVQFVLYVVIAGNTQATPSILLHGDFSMNLDFITYKK